VTYPAGPKCCGSCTGISARRTMNLSHGDQCGRVPWLGLPAIDTTRTDWVNFRDPVPLNETLNRSFGSARLVQTELRFNVDGVHMEVQASCFHMKNGVTRSKCTVVIRKDNGDGEWSITMEGPTRAVAKLRASLGFLHCYKKLLEVAGRGPPVNYVHVWAQESEWLKGLIDTAAEATADHNWPTLRHIQALDTLGAAGRSTQEEADESEEDAVVIAQPASSSTPQDPRVTPDPNFSLWGVYGPAWAASHAIPETVSAETAKIMVAAVRYHAPLYAVPNPRTKPETRIIPISQVRLALAREKRARKHDWSVYDDDALLNLFLADVKASDTAKHGGVKRYSRTTVDPARMYPLNAESDSAMQQRGEPCLVVRVHGQDII